MTLRLKPPATRRRAAPVDHEGQEQAVLVRWLHAEKMRHSHVGQAYDHLYHVPNGGHRNKKTAADLKKQGVKAGVPDLTLAMARGGYFGLYIEFKATPPRNARLADSQREWLERLNAQGYAVVLGQGLESARGVIREYMKMPPTQVMGERIAIESGTEWRK